MEKKPNKNMRHKMQQHRITQFESFSKLSKGKAIPVTGREGP
jgi:hypothetical protein